MGFTSILMLAFVVIFLVMLKIVIDGIKQKNIKMIIIPIVGFVALVILAFYGLILFITSM